MNDQLAEIIALLEAMIKDNDAQMFVAVETGFDESGLIGTRDAYIHLAKILLEFVVAVDKNQLETWTLNGVPCPGSTQISALFDSLNEVVLDTTAMTQTTQHAREIMERYRDQ